MRPQDRGTMRSLGESPMGQAGVTLIELAVGLTIGAAVLSAAYGALAVALDRREAALAAVERDLAAAAVRTSLRSWLESARVPAESSDPLFSGADGAYEGLPDDRLSFVTSASTPLGSALTSVVLYVDRDPETPEEGLVAMFDEWLGTRRLRLELVSDAVGLDVRYRSALLTGRPWHPSWISTTLMPAGVELTLHAEADQAMREQSVHPVLLYPLRVALPGGR